MTKPLKISVRNSVLIVEFSIINYLRRLRDFLTPLQIID